MAESARLSGRANGAFVIAAILTLWQQAVAVSADAGKGPLGVCPQPRKTQQAPSEFLSRTNPLPATPTHIQAGKKLYMETANPLACAQCHGNSGDGQGVLGAALMPPPRNFTCGKAMKDLSDGQLFWIIKNGSPGTGMMAFPGMPDDEAWELVHYIRSLAR